MLERLEPRSRGGCTLSSEPPVSYAPRRAWTMMVRHDEITLAARSLRDACDITVSCVFLSLSPLRTTTQDVPRYQDLRMKTRGGYRVAGVWCCDAMRCSRRSEVKAGISQDEMLEKEQTCWRSLNYIVTINSFLNFDAERSTMVLFVFHTFGIILMCRC